MAIDIKQINLAIKTSTKRYIQTHDEETYNEIIPLLYANNVVYDEILKMSEKYLKNNIPNKQVLEESINWLRTQNKLDKQANAKNLIDKFLENSNCLN